MAFKLVLLWTDVALWVLVFGGLAYGVRVRRYAHLRANWARVFRDPMALSSGVVLAFFLGLTLLDSIHWRSQLPLTAPGLVALEESQSEDQSAVFDTRTRSLLDFLFARQMAMREVSYSAPLAYQALSQAPTTQTSDLTPNQESAAEIARAFPRLTFGGAHLKQPENDWVGDVARRAATGLAGGVLVVVALTLLLLLLLLRSLAATHGGARRAWADVWADRTRYPWRAALLSVAALVLIGGPALALMDHYHVLGTDRTGNDVLYQTLKSVRTAFVIGTLSTLATLPFALLLGVAAGYFGGWVDELIQYLYTTLSSVPNVLLIAACVLMVQVFLDKNPELFETGLERADLKVFMLCLVLGVTGWAGLCRLLRAETLKLRELDYVQAATAFGLGPARIMARHIVPNVMHLVLITVVLSFSELILYEAVLTYVGVGVDPQMNSFGSMINLARTELSRDPLVWWNFCAAFVCMLALVLAANVFADAVRDAFDPRAPRLPRKSRRLDSPER